MGEAGRNALRIGFDRASAIGMAKPDPIGLIRHPDRRSKPIGRLSGRCRSENPWILWGRIILGHKEPGDVAVSSSNGKCQVKCQELTPSPRLSYQRV